METLKINQWCDLRLFRSGMFMWKTVQYLGENKFYDQNAHDGFGAVIEVDSDDIWKMKIYD